MTQRKYINPGTVGYIKEQVGVLNAVVLLTIVVLLVLVVRFLYTTLDYLSAASEVTLVAVMVMLSVGGMLIARTTSRRAIHAIDDYAGKLNSLISLQKDAGDIHHADLLLERVASCAREVTRAETAEIGGVRETIDGGGGKIAWATVKSLGEQCIVPLREGGEDGGRTINITKGNAGTFSTEEIELAELIAEFASKFLDSIRSSERLHEYEIHVTNILVSAMEGRVDKRGHSGRVANYCLHLADRIDMPEEDRAVLHRAALLHDIGYLKLPLDIIASDNGYMKHSTAGFEMLRPIDFYRQVAPIVLHHHEAFDGSGYPHGLSGADIPVESRIIAIAEAFDAMVMGKSYGSYRRFRAADDADKLRLAADALEELGRMSGTQFDPLLVGKFINSIDLDRVAELCGPPVVSWL